ncbi:DUF3347 domain-containing protein [Myxococcota bacterium]
MKRHQGTNKAVLVNAVAAVLLIAMPAIAHAGAGAFDKAMQPILAEYLKIQVALAGDTMAGIKTAATTIEKQVAKLDVGSVTGEHAAHYKGIPAKLKAAAAVLRGTSEIESARNAFKELSKPLAMWGTMSKPKGIDVVFCSMAKGSWLQKRGEVRNPYYGASMLTCGEVVGGDAHRPSGHQHGGH